MACKILTPGTAQGIAIEVFKWVNDNSIEKVRITQHKDHLEFRYNFWKTLPDHKEAELIKTFGFQNDWIEDSEGFTREYYILKTK